MKGKKTGGRQLGTPNRINQKMRQTISEALEVQMATINELLMEMEPRDRINAIIRLMPYIMAPAQYDPSETEKHPDEIRIFVLPSPIPLAENEADIIM